MWILAIDFGRTDLNKQFGIITPYLFEENFIISLNKKWLNFCKNSLNFSIEIDHKGRLLLVGPVIEFQNKEDKEEED